MTEPTVAEIIARWEQDAKIGFYHMGSADIRALIASHKALVEALVACRPHILSGQLLMQIDAALKAAGEK